MSRTNNCLFRITSASSLHNAWSKLHKRSRARSRNTQGIDGLSINDFSQDHKANLNRLVRDVREGQFHFQKLLPHFIPKKNGKYRIICVPTVRDRIIQRALLDFVSSKYKKNLSNKISYGFIEGRGVHKAAEHACNLRRNHQWVYKTDITSFFDSIDRARLEILIKNKIREKSLHAILIEAAHCEVHAADESATRRITKQGIHDGLGVRQGMPLSPMFSNLILQPFDSAVSNKGYRAVRYADDLIFFADSRNQCLEIDEFCRAELLKLGLDIPHIEETTKSIIYGPTEAAEFLGLGICLQGRNYELKLLTEQISHIRQELLQLGSINELLARGITLARLGITIQSRINGYMSAYEVCSNIAELENEIADLHQKVLRKIYHDGLRIDLNGLPTEARTFLGLN